MDDVSSASTSRVSEGPGRDKTQYNAYFFRIDCQGSELLTTGTGLADSGVPERSTELNVRRYMLHD